MKNFTNIFLYVYAATITVLSFLMVNKLQKTKKENEELVSHLVRTQEALQFKIEECESYLDLESDQDERYEMEVSYWGQMYDAMKEKHPKTAAALEKENFIPNTDYLREE
jgi:low affinity Fe/Cu permease